MLSSVVILTLIVVVRLSTVRTDNHKQECSDPEKTRIGCLNGGKCFKLYIDGFSLHCSCPSLYTGSRCQFLDPFGGIDTQSTKAIDINTTKGTNTSDNIVNIASTSIVSTNSTTPGYAPTTTEAVSPTGTETHRLSCTPMEERKSACLNGGRCFVLFISARTVSCQCPRLYAGSRCQFIDPFGGIEMDRQGFDCRYIRYIETDVEGRKNNRAQSIKAINMNSITNTPVNKPITSVDIPAASVVSTKSTTPGNIPTTSEAVSLMSTQSHRLPCTPMEEKKAACLNGGRCFVLFISARSVSCQCPSHYTGKRCLFLDLHHFLSGNKWLKR